MTTTVADSLAERVTETLRGLIDVRVPKSHFILSRPDFWPKCRLITPMWREEAPSQIFVDGFVRCCHLNSWKVFVDALEDGMSLWFGYAFYGSSWTHHAWCMISDRIVESTAPFRCYYGAELTQSEIALCEEKYSKVNLIDGPGLEDLQVYTSLQGRRVTVPYDRAIHAIGGERDPVASAIKDGLGRDFS